MIDRRLFLHRVRSAASLLTAIPGVLALGMAMIALSPAPTRAGEADVTDVRYQETTDGIYRFDVTVRHADDGWDHYADRWQVLAPEGSVLGERVLLHPHDAEQPFTRSQSGIAIPAHVTAVTVRAHDSRHGWGGAELEVEMQE